jgi:hypothetical protein
MIVNNNKADKVGNKKRKFCSECPEDKGNMFFRNVGTSPSDYKSPWATGPKYEYSLLWNFKFYI